MAGVDDKVTITIGPAVESLAQLGSAEPFDLVFIDADKPSYTIYFAEAKRLVRKGGVIVRSFITLSKCSLIGLIWNEHSLWIMSFGLDAWVCLSTRMSSHKAYEGCSKPSKAMMKLRPLQLQLLVRRVMMVSFTLSRNDNFVELTGGDNNNLIPVDLVRRGREANGWVTTN